MSKKIYTIMQKILAEKGSKNADIKYLGSIELQEDMPVVGKVDIKKDIFVLIDKLPNGITIRKYYDEDMACIAGRGMGGEIYVSREKLGDDLGFLNEINSIDESQELSLKELDKLLDKVARILKIDKSDVLSLSKVQLDQAIQSKNSDELDISDDTEPSLDNEKQNNNILNSSNIKQEIDLSKKIDNRYSLADKLGVSQSDELLIVYSSAVINNETTTRFTPVIRHTNGQIEQAKNLRQIGGIHSDKNVYETNRDGSKVEKKNVTSSFMIEGSNNLLTIRNGDMGRIEVGFGGTDVTSHRDAFTQRLETREMYYVTREVREEFKSGKGTRNFTHKLDEIENHEEHGCDKLTLDEADGDLNTGHLHSDEVVQIILSDEEVGSKINEAFTENEIKERFDSMRQKNPNLSFDELIEVTKAELSTDAEYIRPNKTL